MDKEETLIYPVDRGEALKVLLNFLSFPLYDSGTVISHFRTLPNAEYYAGTSPMNRFVYIPGSRKDRVLLTAHADTVWDEYYTKTRIETTPLYDEISNTIKGTNPEVGLGADDRAGCALLSLLKDSGHSILIFDGEEHGHFGAAQLCKNSRLLREVNRHRYMISLDYPQMDLCHYHGISNNNKFCRYIETQFSSKEVKTKSGTDVSHIAKGACGVNLSIGYYRQHHASEFLSFSAWYNCYIRLCTVLSHVQPRFRTQLMYRLKKKCHAVVHKVKLMLKRFLHMN